MGINERARGGLNWAEKVLHALPGFQGYCERELRRDADRLQREFIAQKLQKVKDVMAEAINVAGRQQKMDLLSGYDELTRLLERTLNEYPLQRSRLQRFLRPDQNQGEGAGVKSIAATPS